MKRIVSVLVLLMLLVACSNKEPIEVVEPIETILERVDLKYKTIEEDSEELEEGKREVVTEGKDGYKVVVYEKGTDRYLNEWVYEEPIHEVVKVGIKKEVVNEPIDSQTSESGLGTTAGGSMSEGSTNTGGGYTPPATGGTTQPPTNNGGGVNTTPPTNNGGGNTGGNTCPTYPGNDGNGWWSDFNQALKWADEESLNENSKWYLYGFDIYGSGNNDVCGYYIIFY